MFVGQCEVVLIILAQLCPIHRLEKVDPWHFARLENQGSLPCIPFDWLHVIIIV